MPNIIEVSDPSTPELADYLRLTDVVLRSKHEPAKGLFIAEGELVIRRAVAAGYRPRSFLMARKWIAGLADVLEQFSDVPVFIVEEPFLAELTGFHVHRGALASMQRSPLPTMADLLHGGCGQPHKGTESPRRVVVLEDIVNHTNVGAVFRSAAALGVDAVLISPRCADPLYRRSIKVSMGTVFQVPWTRLDSWPSSDGPHGAAETDSVALLKEAGFTIAALALTDRSVDLDLLEAEPPEKLALVLGTEGDGLTPQTLAACDLTVRIPMAGGVDSLNVAAASAVAFWATRSRAKS